MDKKAIFIPCLISSLSFIVNPVLGIMFLIGHIAFGFVKDKMFFVLFLQMALFLGLINTTRSFEEGDLVSYLEYFKSASNSDLLTFLKITEQEPAYYSFMFFINRLSGANFKIFIFFHTVVAYYFYFLSIFKINRALYKRNSNLLFVILFASFFYTLFSLSAHLMRQFMATSIFLYFLINRLFYNRNFWLLLIFAILCHTSIVLFLPLIFIKNLGEKIKPQNFLKIVLLPTLSIFVFVYFNAVFVSIGGPFNYIASRVSENTFDDGNTTALITIIFTIILLILSTITIYFNKRNNCSWIYFNHLVIITCCFVLITIKDYPLLSLRYGFYLYFFFPIVFSHYIKKNYFGKATVIIQSVLVFSMVLFFVYMIDNGVFGYLPLNQILIYNLFHYFI